MRYGADCETDQPAFGPGHTGHDVSWIWFRALSTAAGRLLPRGDAVALVYGTVMRNLSMALAIAINAFGEQGAGAALVVAMAYVIQVQSAAWYVKFTDRRFGREEVRSKAEQGAAVFAAERAG